MRCEQAREGLSARLDGEDPGVPEEALDVHLRDCLACRGWSEAAVDAARPLRLSAALPARDLVDGVAFDIGKKKRGKKRRVGVSGDITAGPGAGLEFGVEDDIAGKQSDGPYAVARCAAGLTISGTASRGGLSASAGGSSGTRASCGVGVGYKRTFSVG